MAKKYGCELNEAIFRGIERGVNMKREIAKNIISEEERKQEEVKIKEDIMEMEKKAVFNLETLPDFEKEIENIRKGFERFY